MITATPPTTTQTETMTVSGGGRRSGRGEKAEELERTSLNEMRRNDAARRRHTHRWRRGRSWVSAQPAAPNDLRPRRWSRAGCCWWQQWWCCLHPGGSGRRSSCFPERPWLGESWRREGAGVKGGHRGPPLTPGDTATQTWSSLPWLVTAAAGLTSVSVCLAMTSRRSISSSGSGNDSMRRETDYETLERKKRARMTSSREGFMFLPHNFLHFHSFFLVKVSCTFLFTRNTFTYSKYGKLQSSRECFWLVTNYIKHLTWQCFTFL